MYDGLGLMVVLNGGEYDGLLLVCIKGGNNRMME